MWYVLLVLKQINNAGANAANRPGTHAEHHIAGSGRIQNGLWQCPDVIDKNRLDVPGHTQCTRQTAPIGSHQCRFAGGIDLGQQHCIGLGDDFDKIVETVPCAGVAVRLKYQQQAPSRKPDSGGYLNLRLGNTAGVSVTV